MAAQKQGSGKPVGKKKAVASDLNGTSRSYLKQADVPSVSFDEALRVPKAIFDNYAGQPTTALNVALALEMEIKGGRFRSITGAAISYGLISGGAQATSISVTELSRRIFKPLKEGDDLIAKREAILQPKVFSTFLNKYNNNSIPKENIALNVIEELGVPASKTKETFERIIFAAESVGFISKLKDKMYVNLSGASLGNLQDNTNTPDPSGDDSEQNESTGSSEPKNSKSPEQAIFNRVDGKDKRLTKVFISHGKNKSFIQSISELLQFGELQAKVSTDTTTVSKPVPSKVMDDMRECGAAIIHVEVEKTLTDANGKEVSILNQNVMIEIGAAMALYGDRYILLVKEGTVLPSNLQGLFEVRYSGDQLLAPETIRLMHAIKDLKNHPLP